MSIYLYIFIMTIGILSVVFVAAITCLKSHDKLFEAIEKVKQIKASNTNELSWKPSKKQMEALFLVSGVGAPKHRKTLESLYNDLLKNYKL